jgi:hypothetical protein
MAGTDSSALSVSRGGEPPVITLVRFAVAGPGLAPAALQALFERTAPRYRTIPGLVRKHFLSAPGVGGGCYEWRSRAAAEAWFDAAWHAQMRTAYGVEPQIDWYEAPCVVDNVAGSIDVHVAAP